MFHARKQEEEEEEERGKEEREREKEGESEASSITEIDDGFRKRRGGHRSTQTPRVKKKHR